MRVDCSELNALRRELRRKVGDTFNSMSALLGSERSEDRFRIGTVSDFA